MDADTATRDARNIHDPMTVRELIERLQQCNPNARVVSFDGEWRQYDEITHAQPRALFDCRTSLTGGYRSRDDLPLAHYDAPQIEAVALETGTY